MVARRADGTLR